MKTAVKIISIMLVLSAIFLIGNSITGLVISQSCCFGEDCEQEYLCDHVKNTQNDVVDINLGVFFLLGSVSLYKFAHEKKNSFK